MSKAKTWSKVENVHEFLNAKAHKNRGKHQPRSMYGLHWPVCARCGLLYLRNELTAKAIASVCEIEE